MQKLREWYAQSYLLGVPDIFVGFRDLTAGTLQETRWFKTAEISDQWDPRVDLDFAERTLKQVRAWISTSPKTRDRPQQVWRLSFLPGPNRETSLRPLDLDEERKLAHRSEIRVGFLPAAFYREALAL